MIWWRDVVCVQLCPVCWAMVHTSSVMLLSTYQCYNHNLHQDWYLINLSMTSDFSPRNFLLAAVLMNFRLSLLEPQCLRFSAGELVWSPQQLYLSSSLLQVNVKLMLIFYQVWFMMIKVRGGRVVRCRTCDREVMGSNPTNGCCVPTPT